MRVYSCEFYFEHVMIISKTKTATRHKQDSQEMFRSLWMEFTLERCSVGLVSHCHRSTSGLGSMAADLDRTSKYSASTSLVVLAVVVDVEVE